MASSLARARAPPTPATLHNSAGLKKLFAFSPKILANRGLSLPPDDIPNFLILNKGVVFRYWQNPW